ncbi:hypothetical protein QJQ45_029981 [Haematococcus lacustris]|nr:hypothetical protein QJQ45_029981 [Haematococcus lacustris]
MQVQHKPVQRGVTRSLGLPTNRGLRTSSRILTLSTTPTVNAASVLSRPPTSASEPQEVVSSSNSAELSVKYEPYVWTKHWYPVASVVELDETRPTPMIVLGKELVVWRDGTNTWRAFQDMCPHRLAPLSEGRVEKDGSLLCAYHAWRFDGSGACKAIPQARDKEQEALATRAPRACAKAYPTCEVQGLVWVWPDDSPNALLESMAEGPRLIDEMFDESLKDRLAPKAWRSAELPYGHDYFLENVVDPSHVVVSHHNIVGNRYTDPSFIDLQQQKPLNREEGFQFQNLRNKNIDGTPAKNGVTITTDFKPPCLVRISSVDEAGAQTILALYSTPSRPGYTRHVGAQIFVEGRDGKKSKGLGVFSLPLPIWLLHLMGPAFLHQDAVFLHWQEKIAARGKMGSQRAVDKYFTPTSADKMVLALRQWLERFSPAGVPFYGAYANAPLPEVERDPAKLFDTWNAHTKHCKICKKAHDNMEKLQPVAWAIAAVAAWQAAIIGASSAAAKASALAAAGASVGTATTTAALALPPVGAVVCGGVALLAVGVALLLSKLVSLYHVFPFSHADNH